MFAKTKKLTLALACAASLAFGGLMLVPAPAAEAGCIPICDFSRSCPPGLVAATECGVPVCVKICAF